MVGEHRYGIYLVTDPEVEGVMLPAGDRDRWLYGVVHPPDSPLAGLDEAQMARRIEVAAGVAGLEPRIERIGGFSFAAQMADRYREAGAFLIGDAAHRATPRGGTGMNTAIHDGFDLGWKLAWVLNGWSDPDLLDSYERERRPVAAHNVEFSAQPPGSPPQPPGHALAADLGGRIRTLGSTARPTASRRSTSSAPATRCSAGRNATSTRCRRACPWRRAGST